MLSVTTQKAAPMPPGSGQIINPVKEDRSRVNLANSALVRHWTKTLGVSKAEIVRAVEKVGDNAETVRKELARMTSEADDVHL